MTRVYCYDAFLPEIYTITILEASPNGILLWTSFTVVNFWIPFFTPTKSQQSSSATKRNSRSSIRIIPYIVVVFPCRSQETSAAQQKEEFVQTRWWYRIRWSYRSVKPNAKTTTVVSRHHVVALRRKSELSICKLVLAVYFLSHRCCRIRTIAEFGMLQASLTLKCSQPDLRHGDKLVSNT